MPEAGVYLLQYGAVATDRQAEPSHWGCGRTRHQIHQRASKGRVDESLCSARTASLSSRWRRHTNWRIQPHVHAKVRCAGDGSQMRPMWRLMCEIFHHGASPQASSSETGIASQSTKLDIRNALPPWSCHSGCTYTHRRRRDPGRQQQQQQVALRQRPSRRAARAAAVGRACNGPTAAASRQCVELPSFLLPVTRTYDAHSCCTRGPRGAAAEAS